MIDCSSATQSDLITFYNTVLLPAYQQVGEARRTYLRSRATIDLYVDAVAREDDLRSQMDEVLKRLTSPFYQDFHSMEIFDGEIHRPEGNKRWFIKGTDLQRARRLC